MSTASASLLTNPAVVNPNPSTTPTPTPSASASPGPSGAPAAYRFSSFKYLGVWQDPRSMGSYSLGAGQVTQDSAGLHLFTEVSGKPFVDGELPEWPSHLYSTDQIATASASDAVHLGAPSVIVATNPVAAPNFSDYAKSACTNSTVFFNGYYYTYFEAFEQPAPGLYVLGIFVGRSITIGGNRQILVTSNAGAAAWETSPTAHPWRAVVSSYLLNHYQIGAHAPAGPSLGTLAYQSTARQDIWATGMPNAVVVGGVIKLFYLDPSFALAPAAKMPAAPAVTTSSDGKTHCYPGLQPLDYVNGRNQTCACPAGVDDAHCVHDSPSPPFTFVVSSADPIRFDTLKGSTLLMANPAWGLPSGAFWGESVNIRYVDQTKEFVQLNFARILASSGAYANDLTLSRSADGVNWTGNDRTAATNGAVVDLAAYASYYGSGDRQSIVMGGDASNHLSLAAPFYLGLNSRENIPSGNFSMNYSVQRSFGYQASLSTAASAAASPPATPVGGPTDAAQDFNPNLALALESYQTDAQFKVCGAGFDPVVTNVWAEAFLADAGGLLQENPAIYSGTSTVAGFQISAVPATTPAGSNRRCYVFPLSATLVSSLKAGWRLSFRIHSNARAAILSVAVPYAAGGTSYYHTDPTNAPLALSSLRQIGNSITFCGTGLYASRRNIYALLRWVAPDASGTQPDIFYLPSNPLANPEPLQAPAGAVLNDAQAQFVLHRYIDPSTRLQCGALPFSPQAQALLGAGWRIRVGVGDADSGQLIRVPLE